MSEFTLIAAENSAADATRFARSWIADRSFGRGVEHWQVRNAFLGALGIVPANIITSLSLHQFATWTDVLEEIERLMQPARRPLEPVYISLGVPVSEADPPATTSAPIGEAPLPASAT
ncbi:hypothetical protein [Oryzibacter oryziterrae]|uniref:hypothetical protein n=1 Tax=Oryzibacter oryziterrae TaxID=2766474 RepID=UPI001F1CE8A8|nr:hypothetical protein [Oryzibacter oryziterrae]